MWVHGSRTQSPWSSESALTSKWEVVSNPTCKARAATQQCTGCLVLNTTLMSYKRPQHACDIQALYLYLTCTFQRDVPSYRLQTCCCSRAQKHNVRPKATPDRPGAAGGLLNTWATSCCFADHSNSLWHLYLVWRKESGVWDLFIFIYFFRIWPLVLEVKNPT